MGTNQDGTDYLLVAASAIDCHDLEPVSRLINCTFPLSDDGGASTPQPSPEW